MCGIAGFVDVHGPRDQHAATAARMANSILHRGPDDHGVWTDPEAGVALAHRRLSIVDLSPAGHQPMISECGRWAITFNGEIYNHGDLRAEIERIGAAPKWHGHCDTEVLLAAVSTWGIRSALERCVGMFAFALWDRRERTLTLARDRLGEKPLYYGPAARTFLFGSELSALQAHPDWNGEIDRDALALFLRLNCVPAPRTIFKGVSKLLPGTFLVLKAGEREGRVETYWDAREMAARGIAQPFTGSDDEAITETEALIRQSLDGQMKADVPLGAFLSGGIDSSTVVALMQQLSTRPVQTFSIGFKEAGYDEAPYAAAVAEHLGTDHTQLYVTAREAMDVVPKLSTIYGEPYADASQIPTFLVSQLARRSVTVSLSGDGGDELFSGYTRYSLANKHRTLARVPLVLQGAAGKVVRSFPPERWDRALRTPLRLLPARMRPQLVGEKLHKTANILGSRTPDEAYVRLISYWQRPDLVVRGAAPSLAPMASLGPDEVADPTRRMMYYDLVGYLPDDILVKVDRASMAVGLEARVPLLDHRLVEFSWRLPMSLLRRNGQSKWPLRQILSKYVPNRLIERPKMGFGVPIDSWLRGELKDWAESLLAEDVLKRENLFDPDPIRKAWSSHLAGHRNLQHQLWSVLMFQSWYEAQRSGANSTTLQGQLAGA